MFYLIFGYKVDTIFLIENAVMALTPWLCLGAFLLFNRIWLGRFDATRSYFLTTLLVTFLFLVVPVHCGCIGWGSILEGAFGLSATVSLISLSLNYAYECHRGK